MWLKAYFPLAEKDSLAANLHSFPFVLAAQYATPLGDLVGQELIFSSQPVPIRNQAAMGRAGDRIFSNTNTRGKKA